MLPLCGSMYPWVDRPSAPSTVATPRKKRKRRTRRRHSCTTSRPPPPQHTREQDEHAVNAQTHTRTLAHTDTSDAHHSASQSNPFVPPAVSSHVSCPNVRGLQHLPQLLLYFEKHTKAGTHTRTHIISCRLTEHEPTSRLWGALPPRRARHRHHPAVALRGPTPRTPWPRPAPPRCHFGC